MFIRIPKFVSLIFVFFIFFSNYSSSQQKPAQETVLPVISDNEESRLFEELKRGKKIIDNKVYDSKEFTIRFGKRIEPPPFDFGQDFSSLSLEEIRYLKFELYARKGYLFNDAAVRANFYKNDWYQPVYWIPNPDFNLDEQEKAFYEKVKARENELLSMNYISANIKKMFKDTTTFKAQKVANTANVINMSQYNLIDDEVMEPLNSYGFTIVRANHDKMFKLYEQNDYEAIPSFITTDVYAQLLHEFYVYLFRNIEEDKLIPLVTDIVEAMYKESVKLTTKKSGNRAYDEAAEFNVFYFAIPYSILTGKKVDVGKKYRKEFEATLNKIENAGEIEMIETESGWSMFDYTQFIPRGNYDRTEKLKKYFKAMMWLQLYSSSTDSIHEVTRMLVAGHLLATKSDRKGNKLIDCYSKLNNVLSFMFGTPDDISMLIIVQGLKNLNIAGNPDKYLTEGNVSAITKELINLNPRKMLPGGSLDTAAVIRFLPQRYNFDGHILLHLADLESRPFPTGLDVFAAQGSETAENILLNINKEGENWPEYPDSLKKVKEKFSKYQFSDTYYENWMFSLKNLLAKNESYPIFMQSEAWEAKNLNTALAAWTELKHDAILYAKQPVIAECGGGGPESFTPPPCPRAIGYVEPNTGFWEACLKILADSKEGLKKHNMLNNDLKAKFARVEEIGMFLLNVSRKELKKERLTSKEYDAIKIFGSSIENLTNEFMFISDEDKEYLKEMTKEQISAFLSRDAESMALVADVFTNNDQCLEEAVGDADEIYVIVEIEGYLYLTRGAVFSYYEFVKPSSERMTDEDWRGILFTEPPAMPEWLKKIILPAKDIDSDLPEGMPIEVKECYDHNYSSGC